MWNLQGQKEKLPVVAQDAATQQQEAQKQIMFGAAATVVGILGVVVFGFARRLGLAP